MRRHTACWLFVLLILAVAFEPAHAAPVAPGSSASLSGTIIEPGSALAGDRIIYETQPFSFSAYGGTVMGSVDIMVIRSSVDDTLDFYWRIFNDQTSAGAIGSLRLGGFLSTAYNPDYILNDAGDIGPNSAMVFASPYEGCINFNFSQGLAPGLSSKYFFLDTTAKYYARTALYDLTRTGQSQKSGVFSTYAPSTNVPLPGTLLLFAPGILGLVCLRRRADR